MNVENLILITAALLIWTQIVEWTTPRGVGRVVVGILGSIIIGLTFAMNGMTVFGVQ